MTRSILRVFAAIACCLALKVAVLPSQTRDVQKVTGTAAISGTVTTDEEPHRPLRRATVTLVEASGTLPSRLAVTNDGGKFSFRDLPAGKYSVMANLPPYLTSMYGARRIAGTGYVATGTPIAVNDGDQVKDIGIRLARGGVITGTVRDIDGQPMRGAFVTAMYYRRATTGERYLASVSNGSSTDDRGVYRLFGLAPGEYVVKSTSGIAGAVGQETTMTTDEDVRRAQDLIQRPGSTIAAIDAGGGGGNRRPQPVGYPAMYFPDAFVPERATLIKIEAAEERAGVDFQLQRVSMFRVEGSVVGLDASPAARASVTLYTADAAMEYRSGASTDPQGRFRISGVLPGSYAVYAVSAPQPNAPQAWARTEVTIAAADGTVSLMLHPGMKLSGRLAVDPLSTSPQPDLTKVRLFLVGAASNPMGGGSAVVQPSGEFTVGSVMPGRYRFDVSVTGSPSSWYVASSTIRGESTLDVPVEIRDGETITDAAIVLTDRTTELTGTLLDASGRAAPDYFIIAFTEDSTYWTPASRRIQQTRPSHDGKFAFKNLPPGNYRLAAVTDIEVGEWFDPAFLRQLVDSSVRFTLTANEKKVQNIQIR